MEKSRDAFRTISEVAQWLGTPTHVLRFWESRFSQVKPVKRAGGRRYYRPTDMELLGGIKKLLHDDGLTIRGVQKILREEGVKHVAALSDPVDAWIEAEMASDVEVQPEKGNVVHLSPQSPAETEDRAETPAVETPPDRPDPAEKTPDVARAANGDARDEPAPEAVQPTEPAPAYPAPEDAAGPAAAAAPPAPDEETAPETFRRRAIFGTQSEPAAGAQTPSPRTSDEAAPLPAESGPPPEPAPEDAAEKTAPAAEPRRTGPDRDALRPIYERLKALRARMDGD